VNRREFLAAAASSSAIGLAGCSSIPGTGGSGGSLPDYHRYVPSQSLSADDSGFAHLDVQRLLELGLFGDDETDTPTPTETPTPEPDAADPLITASVGGAALVVLFGLGFGLASYGDYGSTITDQLSNEELESPSDSDVSAVTFASSAAVVQGSFDTESYGGALPDSFSEGESRNGYTLHSSDDDETLATAISGDSLVIAFVDDDEETSITGTDALNRVLDAEAGDVDRMADISDDTDWTLRNAGDNSFVIGYGSAVGGESGGDGEDSGTDTSDFNPLSSTPLENAELSAVVSGASVDSFQDRALSADAQTAAINTGEGVEASAIEDTYSESDASVSADTSEGSTNDAQRVLISATFQDETFDPNVN